MVSWGVPRSGGSGKPLAVWSEGETSPTRVWLWFILHDAGAHLQGQLFADIGESRSELQEELGDMGDQSFFQVAFVMLLAQRQEVENVGVLQGLPGKVGLGRGQGGGKFGDGVSLALVEAALDLVHQDAAAPILG